MGEKGMNVLLSCYFTSRPDPQRGECWKPDDFSVFKDWYWSQLREGVESVIFHDGLSRDFRAPLVCKFVMCDLSKYDYSLNDCRFFIWRDYVRRLPTNANIFITDISDVEFYRNPFHLIEDADTLYIGSNDTWREKPKQHEKMKSILTAEQFNQIMDKPLINPGIIGGSHAVVSRFLGDMCAGLARFNASVNMNMPIANKVIYFGGYKYETGFPLHTLFKEHEGCESGAYIRHK